jgi:phage-related protein
MDDAIVEQTTTSMKDTEKDLGDKFKETLGTLAEEASSELVQAELASMGQAIQKAAQNLVGGLSSSLKAIQAEFEGVEIDGNTPMSVLNDLMSRYPKTTDPKG